MKKGTWTTVTVVPSCDFHPGRPARYDAKTKQGPWAYMCRDCWVERAAWPSLGVGRGQMLLPALPGG